MWFQDARADSLNGEPIFTDPYVSLGTDMLTITPAAPVYATDGATLLGVVGIDMNFASIESSILSLRIMGDEGYAYLLTPRGGEVAAHPLLNVLDGIQNIVDLEPGVDRDEFSVLVKQMTEECWGSASYEKSGKTWLVSWEHETASGSGAGAATDSGGDGSSSLACSTGGFIVAVTVSEDALLGVSAIFLCKSGPGVSNAVPLFRSLSSQTMTMSDDTSDIAGSKTPRVIYRFLSKTDGFPAQERLTDNCIGVFQKDLPLKYNLTKRAQRRNL